MMRFLGAVLVCALSLLLTGTLSQDVGSILTKPLFDQMLKHRNDAICPAKGYYTYEAFIEAAKSFTAFGTTGDVDTRKREIAALFAHISHMTSGGWADAPDGPYAWGLCCISSSNFYAQSQQGQPCASDNNNYGRSHIHMSSNPDPVGSFKAVIGSWMDPGSWTDIGSTTYIPSPHDAMTSKWTPSAADIAAGRAPGYGVVTNIIDGKNECGKGSNPKMEDRIGFYKRYCDILGVGYGNNLDCANQRPFE